MFRRFHPISLSSAAKVLALCAAPLWAHAATASADADFMRKAASGGMAEVAAGKMAQGKATNADVKAFATHMMDDHGRANDELKQLAGTSGVTLPAGPDAKHKSDAHAMESMSGAAFDRTYMAMMVADHKSTIALFDTEAKNGKDAAAKEWATNTLPTLRAHLKMALDAQKTTMASR